MKFEVDYRDDYDEVENISADSLMVSERPDIETFIQGVDKMAETYHSQFTRVNSLRKVAMIMDAYDKLKEVAEQSCGYASLEINETDQAVTMMFRCEYFFVSNDDCGTKDVVAEILTLLLTFFRSVTFTAENDEVIIQVKDYLYEEVKTTDKSKEIDRIRARMRKQT
ncbi:MAG: hypothetical protein ACRDBO_03970 [Lachnospiraceae bacterium]